MKKPICIHIPQYDVWVVAILGWTFQETRKFIQAKYQMEFQMPKNGICLHLDHPKHGEHFVIVLDQWKRTPQHTALLAHELLHACLLLYSSIGQGVCTKDHEHLTYMHQWLLTSILERAKS